MSFTLAPGEVHVWWRATGTTDDEGIVDSLAVLSAEERQRYHRFRFARDRRNFAAAHALLRTSLSRYAPVTPGAWRFVKEPGGKPSIIPDGDLPPLSFNLSHTDGLVACAVADGANVGIDVESLGRVVNHGVADRFFSRQEVADLRACPSASARTRRFFELWTLKEAYIKAIGQGLSHPLDTIRFTRDEHGASRFEPPPGVDPARWQFAQCTPTDKYCLAVAVSREPQAPCAITLMPSRERLTD